MAHVTAATSDQRLLAGNRRSGRKTGVWNIVSLAVALGVWQIASHLVASPFFPGSARIVEAFVQLATRGDTFGHSLWTHSWASIQRVLVGFGLGVLFGVPLGLLMGLYPKVYAGTRSVIEPFRFIPPIAWIPLAIIFFSGLTRFAFLIFLGAFFPDLHLDPGWRRPRRADPPQGRRRARREQVVDPAPRGRSDRAARTSWPACGSASARPG